LLTGGTGIGLIVSGVSLIGQGPGGIPLPFHVSVGLITLSAGAAALLASVFEGFSIMRKRR
jgi:hypothetical protein